jgi:hypothetical protein
MPDLDPSYFRGTGDIPSDIANRLSTAYVGESDNRALTQLGWEGQAIGFISLTLSPDGASVSRAQFNLKGKLSEDTVIFQAAKLWDKVARDITVHIEPMDGSAFQFLNGTMYSDYAAQEAFKVSYFKGDQKLRPGEEKKLGVGDMCLRIFCHLDKTSNARQGLGAHWKLTTLAFPHTVDNLEEEAQMAFHPSWPEVKILEGKADFFPKAEMALWGCPLYPLLSTENRSAAVNIIPNGAVMRAAISGLCRTAALPTACATRAAMLKKSQDVLANPPQQQGREPTIRWPKETMPPASEGRKIFLKIW